MDKSFTYDLVTDQLNPPGGQVPFAFLDKVPTLPMPTRNLFQPVLPGAVADRLVVLSYDDLERKHFILSALTPDGRTLWSKRDDELPNKLEGEPFADAEQGPLARLSADALYFTNGDYFVCVSLHDGSVIWLLDL